MILLISSAFVLSEHADVDQFEPRGLRVWTGDAGPLLDSEEERAEAS